MVDYAGRVAVITGASRGLGAGLSAAFLHRGLNVAACARSRPACESQEHCLTRALDVTDAAALDAFTAETVERFGRIDLWVNNAGLLEPIGPLRELDPAAIARHIDVNVCGVFYGSRALVRHLHERRGEAVLINISSGAARSAYAGWSAYCAAKAAVDRMSESLWLEEADQGLRVHAVAPGIIDTDMQALIRNCSPEQFPQVQKFLDLKAADRFSTPEFIADRLLELAFDPAHRTADVLVSLPRP
jgi:NAD(P)-dependent dehydrogenase (short-subunit alcohol dehydrogenase family)